MAQHMAHDTQRMAHLYHAPAARSLQVEVEMCHVAQVVVEVLSAAVEVLSCNPFSVGCKAAAEATPPPPPTRWCRMDAKKTGLPKRNVHVAARTQSAVNAPMVVLANKTMTPKTTSAVAESAADAGTASRARWTTIGRLVWLQFLPRGGMERRKVRL